ncbi:MAG TPA: response regulator [Fimbriimonas sp.]|nr:response regulator [Fimbriimonas sp.]
MKILVCDDDIDVLRSIRDTLEGHRHEVVVALNGTECLEMIRSDRPELAIIDVKMPFMDGFAVVRALRSESDTENLPVILISASTDHADLCEGYRCGADMYVVKPIDPHDLIEFVVKAGN